MTHRRAIHFQQTLRSALPAFSAVLLLAGGCSIEPNPSPNDPMFPGSSAGGGTGNAQADVAAPPWTDGGDSGQPTEDTWAGADTWGDGGGTSDGGADTGDTGGETTGGDATGGGTTDGDTGGGTTGGTDVAGTDSGVDVPACTGKQCGPDGAGGSCGWCSGNDSCQEGVCVTVVDCVPDCAGAMIGIEDGCGGVCSGSGMGIGLVPGGAQDAAYFSSQVKQGNVPLPDKLPIEGWLTQHGTALPAPLNDRLVTLHAFVGLFYDPTEGEPTVALQLGMNSGLSPDAIQEGKFNLSVVVDRSGSMAGDNKIEFVKEGLKQMLDILDDDDLLSIVTYSQSAKLLVEPTPVNAETRPLIEQAIEQITANGATNISAGLELGYQQVLANAATGDMTQRVLLLSDGVATQGITPTDKLVEFSKPYNDAGIGLTTIGVGDDLQFDLMHLLATQGGGNFFFLDSADKLAQVFTEELEYLLTPVANNLKIWFTLPSGFGVEDVYGFEYKETNGEFHLLGPAPQYTVSDGEIIDQPTGGTGEDENVAVSTLFASKKNGLLMVKLSSPGADLLAEHAEASLASVYYAYDLVESGETESFDVSVGLGSLEYDSEGAGYEYFSGATMQKNFCVLRAGLAMKGAAGIFHTQGEAGIQEAIGLLAQARTFCTGINVQLNDAQLIEDVALLSTLMDNICGESCTDPAGE